MDTATATNRETWPSALSHVEVETPWCTADEVAAYLKVTRRTVDRYRARGIITAYIIGPRTVRFRKADLDSLAVPMTAGGEPHEAA